MSNMRLGPWDLKRELWDQMNFIRERDGKTWRFMLTEACRLFIASRGLVPHAPIEGSGDGCAHAPNVERLPNLAPVHTSAAVAPVAVEAAPVVPAVELSENEKRLERLYAGRARKQEFWDQGIIELAADPGNVRAANWVRVMPSEVESYNAEIRACEALIAAEKLAKESSGEVVPGEVI